MASNNPSATTAAAQNRRLAPPSTPGGLATTPSRRAASADPTLSGRRPASTRRPAAAATPHARAASRAMDQRRRTIFTPGRVRRRSLRDQRETPRDLLRNLSRVLAPSSQPVHSSSSSSPGREATLTPVPEDDDDDDDDDDFPIERPRFSLPLQDFEDDDDSDLKAPRLSGLEEENYTATSIEFPRRALSEGPSRLGGRDSLGSLRFSDYAGPDLRSDDMGMDSGLFPPGLLDDSGTVNLDDGGAMDRFEADDFRRQTLGRESLFGPIEIPEGVDETTFMMAPVSSPMREPTAMDEPAGDQALDPIDDEDDFVNEPMDYPEIGEHDSTPELDAENVPQDETLVSRTAELLPARGKKTKSGKKISRHGIEYPALPQGVVKRLATTFAKTSGVGKAKLSVDTMDAIMQASDWFFEQLGDDLSAYAKHAGRKTIDESDMITLMRRQRQIGASTTPFSLAQRYLPRELLQELRMPVPPPTRVPRKSKHVEVEEEQEGGGVT